ncbi:DUF4303 domain-containing protein [Dactylosporangium sp. NPDC050688]|uniref:DUF4303 domain-containing protein n=1 Tax=Dactylosporangium sp. NPDC050688 TaxID=3157217 RepID=UPI0033CC9DE6
MAAPGGAACGSGNVADLAPGDSCGYALYSDDGAMTVCCAVHTADHLARVRAADPGDAEYWRWSPRRRPTGSPGGWALRRPAATRNAS